MSGYEVCEQIKSNPQTQDIPIICVSSAHTPDAREGANAAWGPHKVLALPVHLSRTPARVEHAAPMTGEHTRETLAGLGYDTATIDALIAAGIVQQYSGGRT